MLKLEVIGNLGTDTQIVETDGSRFATIRVAHTDSWTGKDGVKHENTQWIDCNLSADSKVLPYLKKGTKVFLRGNMSTRVYSSAKDKCMKSGISLRVDEIQLLSAKQDEQKEQEGSGYDGF